jgi:hypothetical protein
MRTTYTIEYQYGTYRGEEEVTLNDDDDRSPCDVMWAKLRRQDLLTLPMAYQSAKVIDEQPSED